MRTRAMGDTGHREERARARVRMRLGRLASTIDRFRDGLSLEDLEASGAKVDRLESQLLRMLRSHARRDQLPIAGLAQGQGRKTDEVEP